MTAREEFVLKVTKLVADAAIHGHYKTEDTLRVVKEGCAAVEAAYDSAHPAKAEAGWVMVPREPTEAMRRAAQVADMDHSEPEEWDDYEWPDVYCMWQAMLSAAPHASGAEKDAARYRWLRQREVDIYSKTLCPPERSERLDDQIDAAMSGEAKG